MRLGEVNERNKIVVYEEIVTVLISDLEAANENY